MEPIYGNKNIKKHVMRTTGDGALSEESSKSDDITYSEVHIINSNQKRAAAEKEQVIYSSVGFSSPAADLAQNVSGDPSPDARSKVNTGQDKERLLLVALCVLLFAVTLTIGTLYTFGKMDIFKDKNSIVQLQAEKQNLTSELQQSQQHVKQLEEEKYNLTRDLQNPKKNAVHCAVGWTFYSGSCYYFSTDKETWPASRDACISEGGHLVIITSSGEQDFLKGSKSVQNKDTYWIGLTDAVVENDWLWLDGTKLSETPKLWTGNEPDNWKGESNEYPEGEDCAVLDLGHKSYGFLDAPCSEKKHKRICEAKAAM